jgi:hypothetical protein
MAAQYDLCECGGRKRAKSKRCAKCAGYGRGRHVMPSGYVRVWCPGHPMAHKDGYALEHRVVLYEAGVELLPGYHAHHRNGDKADNRIENLEVKLAAQHVGDHVREAGAVENQFGTWRLRSPRDCEVCGESYKPWNDTQRFCSRSCMRIGLRKTHCKRGHELAGENLRIAPDGERVCRACDRIRIQRFKARQAS